MKTLFNAELCDRDFGSTSLDVSKLQEWAADNELRLPRTNPELAAFDVVQIESLLCAIERGVKDFTPAEAAAIIATKPELLTHPVMVRCAEEIKAGYFDLSVLWLLGADAHQQWRKVIATAIAKGELQGIDPVSQLPIGNKSPASGGGIAGAPHTKGAPWTDEEKEQLRADHKNGVSGSDLAARHGVSRQRISKLLGHSDIGAKSETPQERIERWEREKKEEEADS